jgi:hypothetical protein
MLVIIKRLPQLLLKCIVDSKHFLRRRIVSLYKIVLLYGHLIIADLKWTEAAEIGSLPDSFESLFNVFSSLPACFLIITCRNLLVVGWYFIGCIWLNTQMLPEII